MATAFGISPINPPRVVGSVDVALVEIDVFLGEIGGVEHGVALAEVESDMKVEFLEVGAPRPCRVP
jgi:hypothetical protein